jgi:hypothetical protein
VRTIEAGLRDCGEDRRGVYLCAVSDATVNWSSVGHCGSPLHLTLFAFGETLTLAFSVPCGDIPKCHKEPAQNVRMEKRDEHRCGR